MLLRYLHILFCTSLLLFCALNAVLSQPDAGRLLLSTALLLWAGSLLTVDQAQRRLRCDRYVLAYVAAQPKVSPAGAAQALDLTPRAAEASLERLAADGLLARDAEKVDQKTYSVRVR
ncbi:hypothetical protein [Streptomyces sp. NPDC047014]|uniref:hypothetical protein n=1 Tax=Streptomyces sp. NPDC047014 TaxID=3155736 RepID=UPI0033D7E1CC